jgi:hypothetical protein
MAFVIGLTVVNRKRHANSPQIVEIGTMASIASGIVQRVLSLQARLPRPWQSGAFMEVLLGVIKLVVVSSNVSMVIDICSKIK